MQKLWSKTEIAHLKRHAADQSIDELATRLHTDSDTVRRKMEELGLLQQPAPVDETLEIFSEGLKLLHEKDWAAAAQRFEKVIAEADGRRLKDRARQYLGICRQHTDPPADSSDPYLQAVFEKNRGDLDAALAICQGQDTEDERFVYLLASLKAMAGEVEESLELLEKAIALEPKNRVHAFHDPDFADIRGEADFTGLVAKAAS